MSLKDLESKLKLDDVFIRYNVKIEGPATKPEDDPEVVPILPNDEPFKTIAIAVLYGDNDTIYKNTKDALDKGVDPVKIINDGLMKGMDAVSTLYTKGVFFLPDLMLSGDGMMEGVKECEAKLGHKSDTKATVVCFVCEGDPHDIGKNLILMFLRANGYEAIDMGRDVPTPDVVKQAKESNPVMMTGTALMTTTMTVFPKVVDALKDAGIDVPVGCGGGAVRKDFIEAFPMSFYGVEAYHTPKIADAIVDNDKTWEDIRKEYAEIIGEEVPEYE